MQHKIISTSIKIINRTSTLDKIMNFSTYSVVPHFKRKSNFFYKIAEFDNIYLKQPPIKIFWKFEDFLISGETIPEVVQARKSYLYQFSELSKIWKLNDNYPQDNPLSYFSIVIMMYYQRLLEVSPEAIPDARFIFQKKTLFSGTLFNNWPLVLQKKVSGIQLWDMLETNAFGHVQGLPQIKAEWQYYIPEISKRLQPFMESRDIDYNPKNFIYNKNENKLYYVGLMPIIFANIQNNINNKNAMNLRFMN
jgi:hypothetical protein